MDNYQLIFINFDNTINLVNKDVWSNMSNNTPTGWYLNSNIQQISRNLTLEEIINKKKINYNFKIAGGYKITQLHNGKFLYIGYELDLFICDNNFLNSIMISDGTQKFSGVTQLSNYRILLTGVKNDTNLYFLKSYLDKTNYLIYVAKDHYTDLKQIRNSDLIGIFSGNTYKFNFNDDFVRKPNTTADDLKFISVSPISPPILIETDNKYQNYISTFIPGNPITFIFNLDNDYLRQGKLRTYNINGGNALSTRDSRCVDGYEFDGNLTCYPVCRAGYHGLATTCWGSCNEGDKDNGALCQTACRSGYTHNGAGLCYYGDGNLNNYPLSYDRGSGIIPDYSCPTGYQLNGTTCMKCPDGFEVRTSDITTCWNKNPPYDRGSGIVPNLSCPAGYTLNGTTCMKCPVNFHVNPADITTCWNDLKDYQRNNVLLGQPVASIPDYSCPTAPAGYTNVLNDVMCMRCPNGFTDVNKGDITTCYNVNKYYDRGPGVAPKRRGGAVSGRNYGPCNTDGLSNVKTYETTCTGWGNCASGNECVGASKGTCQGCVGGNPPNPCKSGNDCIDWCNNWRHCQGGSWHVPEWCYNNDVCSGWGDCSKRSGCIAGLDPWNDCAWTTPVSCGWDPCKTRTACVPGLVTRNRPDNGCPGGWSPDGLLCREPITPSCPNDDPVLCSSLNCSARTSLEDNKTLCYIPPRNGYNCNATGCTPNGGISVVCPSSFGANASCSGGKSLEQSLCYDAPDPRYNCGLTTCVPKNGSSQICNDYKNNIPSCNSNRQLEDGMCYIPPRDGYKCSVTICSPNGGTSQICNDYKDNVKTCKSNRKLEDGMCYNLPRDGYNCVVTSCTLQSYVPKTYAIPSYDRGVGVNVNAQKITNLISNDNYIKYNITPCDLTFYNILYIKPTNMILPDIPVTDKLYAYYDASSFSNNIWYDLTSNNNHAVYTNGNIQVNGNYLSGNVYSNILFPCEVLPPVYTLLHISRYNGKNNGSILYGYDSKITEYTPNPWYSGFYKNKSGVASHGLDITQTKLSIFTNKWVFSTDTNTNYRANGYDYTTNTAVNDNPYANINSYAQLSINNNLNPNDNSDWAVACIIVFNKNLSISEINSMEFWLTNKYPDLWKLTFSKPFDKSGYSCNPVNNKIGKIINNYSEYEYVSYDKKNTVDCEWLKYPPQNYINGVVCSAPRIDPEATSNPQVNNNSESNNVPKSTINPESKSYGSDVCAEAFNYYDLYPSDIPIVIKGIDPNYSIDNNVLSDTTLYNIGKNNAGAFSQVLEGFDNTNTTNNYYKFN